MTSAVKIYLRLRRAYKRHGVLPYSRRKTWGEAKFAVRIGEASGRHRWQLGDRRRRNTSCSFRA